MQSAQDQPLALTTGRSLCPTNGKEEEMDAGEEAGLAGFFEKETRHSEVKGRVDDMIFMEDPQAGSLPSFNLLKHL